jgi:hypothetical protein
MALAATTLVNAIGANDTVVQLVSVANFSAALALPNMRGVTVLLLVEQEMMSVQSLGSPVYSGNVITSQYVNVTRGVMGTFGSPHGANCPVISGVQTPMTSGFPPDFEGFTPGISASSAYAPTGSQGVGAPIVGGTTNTAVSALFHLTGATAMSNLVAPPGYLEGGSGVTIIFDGSGAGLTWTNTGNINAAGTATTAGSRVNFIYDQSISKWIPSRVS